MTSPGIICGTRASRVALPFGQGFFSILKALYQRLHTAVDQQHQTVLLLSMVRGNDVPSDHGIPSSNLDAATSASDLTLLCFSSQSYETRGPYQWDPGRSQEG